MKKTTRKIISAVSAAAVLLSITFVSSADSIAGNTSTNDMSLVSDDMTLVSEERIYDWKTGLFYIDRTYEKVMPFKEREPEPQEIVDISIPLDMSEPEPNDLSEFELISEEGYTDSQSGLYFVDRTYVKTDREVDSTQGYMPFTKTVEKTRSIYRDASSSAGDLMLVMHVSGEFSSENVEDIRVSHANRYTFINNSNARYKEKKFSSASDQGANFLGGHKYAYVEYIITVDVPNGYKGDLRLWLDVDVNGSEHVAT